MSDLEDDILGLIFRAGVLEGKWLSLEADIKRPIDEFEAKGNDQRQGLCGEVRDVSRTDDTADS